MNATTRTIIVLALVLQGLPEAACAEHVSFTAPTPRAYATISLSGVVYDTAHHVLDGARVEVIDGAVGDWCHYGNQPGLILPACVVSTLTDGFGRFTFSGSPGNTTFGSMTRLQASMTGYVSATLIVDSTTSTDAIEFRLESSVMP